jgi:hypothetical protein
MVYKLKIFKIEREKKKRIGEKILSVILFFFVFFLFKRTVFNIFELYNIFIYNFFVYIVVRFFYFYCTHIFDEDGREDDCEKM